MKTTLEKSGEDVKTTLETSGEDVKTTLETSGKDVKTTLETSEKDENHTRKRWRRCENYTRNECSFYRRLKRQLGIGVDPWYDYSSMIAEKKKAQIKRRQKDDVTFQNDGWMNGNLQSYWT